MFEQNQPDIRFTSERMQFTETTCDDCGEVILESEKRFERPNDQPGVICEECNPKPINPTELQDEIVRFVRGLRGPRQNPVTYKQIVAHVRRLPAFEKITGVLTDDQISDAELECFAQDRIRCVAMTLGSHRHGNGRYGYEVTS